MLFRPARNGGSSGSFYKIKVALLLIGSGVGLAGMLTERSWLVWIGIALLAAAIVLRLIAARSRRD